MFTIMTLILSAALLGFYIQYAWKSVRRFNNTLTMATRKNIAATNKMLGETLCIKRLIEKLGGGNASKTAVTI